MWHRGWRLLIHQLSLLEIALCLLTEMGSDQMLVPTRGRLMADPPRAMPRGLQAPRDTSCAGCLVGWLGFLPVGQGGPLGAHLEVHTLSSKPPDPKCRLLLLFI